MSKSKKRVLSALLKIESALDSIRLSFPTRERVETGYSVTIRGNGYSKVYRVERIERSVGENVALLAPASLEDELLEDHRRLSSVKVSDSISDFLERNKAILDLPARTKRRRSS